MANYTLVDEDEEFIVYVPSAHSVEFYKHLHPSLDAFDVNVGVVTGATPGSSEDAFRFEKIPANPDQQTELARLVLKFEPPAA